MCDLNSVLIIWTYETSCVVAFYFILPSNNSMEDHHSRISVRSWSSSVSSKCLQQTNFTEEGMASNRRTSNKLCYVGEGFC